MDEFDKRAERLDKQLAELDRRKRLFDKQAEIRSVKRSMRRWNPPTTTKIIMALLLINCTVVEVYSMWIMVYLANIDALYSLIAAVIGETVSFGVYAAKAFAETKEEEALKLERDKFEAGVSDDETSTDAVGFFIDEVSEDDSEAVG